MGTGVRKHQHHQELPVLESVAAVVRAFGGIFRSAQGKNCSELLTIWKGIWNCLLTDSYRCVLMLIGLGWDERYLQKYGFQGAGHTSACDCVVRAL